MEKDGFKLIDGIVGSIKYLASLKEQMPYVCADLDGLTNWSAFDAIVENIQNEETSMKYSGIEENMITYNGNDITNELSRSVVDTLRDGDVEEFGRLLAKTLV